MSIPALNFYQRFIHFSIKISTYVWCIHDTTSVGASVASLHVVDENAMEQGITRGFITKLEFTYWLSVFDVWHCAKK